MATYARIGTLYEVGLQQFGEAIIRETFRDAAKLLLGFTANFYEVQSLQAAVVFIQGSGLEATITQFNLPLDPTTLRESFRWKLRQLASASATTLDGHSLKGVSPALSSP